MTVMTTRLLGLAGAVVAVGAVLWFASIQWGKGRAGQAPGQLAARSEAGAAPHETSASGPDHPSQAQSRSPSAEAGQLSGMWEGHWKTRVRSYQVATDVVGLPPGHRQLEHDGTLEARFSFCINPDGTAHGAGKLKVRKNGEARLFKPFEEDNHGAMVDESTCDRTFKPAAVDDVPLTMIGELRSADVWLFLNSRNIVYVHTNSCVERNLLLGSETSYTGGSTLSFPAVGLLFPAGGTALTNGIVLPARDGGMRRVQSSGVTTHSDKFDTLTLEDTQVSIRRDPLAEQPPEITQAGFIFINPPSGRAVSRERPGDFCSEVVGVLPNGARLIYRRVVLNKDTGKPEWYFVEPPAGTPGWIPAADTSNTRPFTPIQPRPPKLNMPEEPGKIEASPTAGSRG